MEERREDHSLEYSVEKSPESPPHGNAKTGLPFYRLLVGEGFSVPPEDYSRVASARAHYQTKNPGTRFSSRSVRGPDGGIVEYVFKRES